MENPYQVLGVSVPPMLGRTRLMEDLARHLTKPIADHMQVVGPARYGKSVLLQAVAEEYRSAESSYIATVYLDLRHSTPRSDGEFCLLVATSLTQALKDVRPDLVPGNPGGVDEAIDLLALMLDELAKEGRRVLLVLDGFDHVFACSGITRSLWDQLRALAQKDSLRFVTGSRRPLRELCRDEASRTSDFWEVFYDSPLRVGAFREGDLADVYAPLGNHGRSLTAAGEKELTNWSGGIPLLTVALLQQVFERSSPGLPVDKVDVDAVAEELLQQRSDLLSALWEDCDAEIRAMLLSLGKGDLPQGSLSKATKDELEFRGFTRRARNQIRSNCLLMQRYAEVQRPDLTALARLFAAEDQFQKNLPQVLQLRFQQVLPRCWDRALGDYLRRAVRDAESDPQIVVSSIRGIVERTRRLIWEAELPDAPLLPKEWITTLEQEGYQFRNEEKLLPTGGGAQVALMRWITDSKISLATHVTRRTFLLLSHLHSVGDFGQHLGEHRGSEVTPGFASSVLLTAIELVASVSDDLGATPG